MSEIDAEAAEIARTRQSQADYAELEAARRATLKPRYDLIRARAKEDPAFKALVEHLGISLEET